MRWEERERGGEKKEKEWTGGKTDPDIHPRGMYIKPTGTVATEEEMLIKTHIQKTICH